MKHLDTYNGAEKKTKPSGRIRLLIRGKHEEIREKYGLLYYTKTFGSIYPTVALMRSSGIASRGRLVLYTAKVSTTPR